MCDELENVRLLNSACKLVTNASLSFVATNYRIFIFFSQEEMVITIPRTYPNGFEWPLQSPSPLPRVQTPPPPIALLVSAGFNHHSK